MKHNLYSVYDMVAGQYAIPFAAHNDGTATRCFSGEIQAGQTQISQAPHDFQLFSIGTFDIETGLIDQHPTPKLVASGSQLVHALHKLSSSDTPEIPFHKSTN